MLLLSPGIIRVLVVKRLFPSSIQEFKAKASLKAETGV
jgi:hypothetical protein